MQGADQGDTTTLAATVIETAEQVAAVTVDAEANWRGIEEVVADNGYHRNEVVKQALFRNFSG